MLSLRSRDEDRVFRKKRKGLGLEGLEEMEENELEEGEACTYRDENSSIYDPHVDVDLSYIDEKIHDVLGHFQKDFEGGVSLENLGATFGGYGSFLPTYQRSPSILSNSRSPATHQSFTHQGNASIPARFVPAPASAHVATVATSLVTSACKEIGTNITMHNVGDSFSKCEPDLEHSNGNGQKSLKVRIKVPPENISARNNAAIYSGLGLDISPSTSLDDSSDDSEDVSPEIEEAPDESPSTMLQIMMSFPFPDGLFLSPLSDVLLRLMERERPLHRENESEAFRKSGLGNVTGYPTSSPEKDVKEQKGKTIMAVDRSRKLGEVKHMNATAEEKGIAAMLKKEVDIETPEGEEILLNALKLPLLASYENLDKYNALDVVKGTRQLPDAFGEQAKITLSYPIEEEARALTGHLGMIKADEVGNETLPMKGKFTLKTNLADKTWEERKDNLGTGRDTKTKIDVLNDFTPWKKNSNPSLEYPKQKSTERNMDEIDCQLKQEWENHLVIEKKRKDNQSNIISTSDSSKERPVSASGSVKRKKKDIHARVDLETLPDMRRFQESNKITDKDCHKDPTSRIEIEHAESRVDSLDTYGKDKSEVPKAKHMEGEPYRHVEEPNETLDAKVFENTSSFAVNVVGSAPPAASNGLISGATTITAVPVVIDEYWVCCDKCQKWRLHPFGPDPTCLPKKWLCSMQHWMPGLNKCTVSEEETNKAFYAFYQVQYQQDGLYTQNGGAVSGVTLPDGCQDGQNPGSTLFRYSASSASGKKKHVVKETNNDSSLIVRTSLPNSTKKNQQTSSKSKMLNDVNQHPSDSNTPNKDTVRGMVMAYEHGAEKQRHKQKKHQSLKSYLNEGDYIEPDIHSKFMFRREPQQDNHVVSKKFKVDGSHMDGEWDPKNEEMGKIASTGVPAELIGKNAKKYSDYYSLPIDSRCNSKENDSTYGKKLKNQVQSSFNGESKLKIGSLNVQKFDKNEISTKKRKMKQWQESQDFIEDIDNKGHSSDSRQPGKDVMHETEHKGEKKAKSSKPEGRESSTRNADVRMEKKGRVMQIVPNSSGDPLLDGMGQGSRGRNEKEPQPSQFNAVSKRISEGTNSLKQDTGCTQHSTAATSSSSKISSSCKAKVNLHEVKGSPVESVSSSPLRISSADKVASKKNFSGKDDVANVGPFVEGSPRRCSDGEVDGGSNRSGITSMDKRSFLVEHVMQNGGDASRSSVLDMDSVPRDNQSGNLKKSKHRMVLNSTADASNSHIADGVDELEQQNHCLTELKDKENNSKRKSFDSANGCIQVKSGKGSSSQSKERQWGTKSDTEKGKFKVFDSFVEVHDEFYSTNNTGEIGDPAHDGFPICEESNWANYRDKGNRKSGKVEKKCLEIKGSLKCSGESRRDIQPMVINIENSHKQSSASATQHADSMTGKSKAIRHKAGRPVLQQSSQRLTTWEDERLFSQPHLNRTDSADLISIREKSQPFPSSQEQQSGSNLTHKISNLDAFNGDTSEVLKQPRKMDNPNVMSNVGLRHAGVNDIVSRELDVRCSFRKENGQTALKEAKDLKHSADRLKNGGLELESIGLYFRSALKFLHGASLLEPNDAEGTKQGDNHSMQIYNDTAKLCGFCAHVYERYKDMAAAALAYKCMEVAYMRVVFLKQSYVNRVRHELLSALPNLPGESSSSSASDVDNLNHHGMSEKAIPLKGVSSPQRPSSLVISARNRRSFDWLLNFANDVHLAMDALKRSQNAFTAANRSLEDAQHGLEGISSARKVIDFNFHDVEGLLHLVRLAMEEISR